ncbi:40755_t:CDS:2, partial [Gigaspora margarita]
ATCFNSLVQNQLALKLTITELAHDNHTVVPNTIREIESLLTVLDKLVAGIAIFESDIPKLALFYNWYHEQLESDDLIAWWEGNFKESSSKLYKVATRVLNILLSSAAAERNWSDFSYIHDKKRNRDNDKSSDDDLIESNNKSKSVESSESETELETDSNIDSEHEEN